MSKIPTAEEFVKPFIKDCTDTQLNLMREFAQLHVTAALKAALEDAPTGSSTDIPSYEEMENAILNAYPLENIK